MLTPPFDLFENLYVAQEAWCGLRSPKPVGAMIAIPDAPGIGFEPEMAVIETFRVG